MKLVLSLLAFLTLLSAAQSAERPMKVFILAGQSNMEGKAKVSLLDYQAERPATRDLYAPLRKDGKWIERDDVSIKFLDGHGVRDAILELRGEAKPAKK